MDRCANVAHGGGTYDNLIHRDDRTRFASMSPLLIRLTLVLLVAVPASARTDEMFTLNPTSQVMLGEEGGDTFSVEPPGSDEVTILLNPAGEDCTLRFPLRKGEAFELRIRGGLNQTLGCQVALSGTGKDKTATFVSSCVETQDAGAPRCPAGN